LKIAAALPEIFKRTYPVLDSGTELILAASLLRFHQIDAIPIGFKKRQKKHLAVLGYSCLSHLLQTKPSRYKRFLEQPCENVAQELSTISWNANIESLLRLFWRTKFGFSMVEGKFETEALISLRDLLGLYKKGILNTSLSIGQVASPIFSMSSDASLKEVLQEMFTRRIRRIFLNGRSDNKVITDRRIISYIFSTSKLEKIQYSPENLLETSVENLETIEPPSLSERLKLGKAAALMQEEIKECLVCEKGVVTPWDMIMKPWKSGKMVIEN
jgi:hypothetical protein